MVQNTITLKRIIKPFWIITEGYHNFHFTLWKQHTCKQGCLISNARLRSFLLTVFAIISIISQDAFHNARKVLQGTSVVSEFIRQNWKLFSVFLLFKTVNKKIHLYIKASGFQFSCSGTSRHKYERSLAIIIPVIRAVSLCAKSIQHAVNGVNQGKKSEDLGLKKRKNKVRQIRGYFKLL